MSSLKNLGPRSLSGKDSMKKIDVDANLSAGVAFSTIQSTIQDRVNTLAFKSVADALDANLAEKAYVDQQDATRILSSTIGVANGVAPLDSSGQIPEQYLGRAPVSFMKGPYRMGTIDTSQVAQRGAGAAYDFQKFIGKIDIPAPGAGFGLWRPLVQGRFELISVDGNGRGDVRAMVGDTSGVQIGRACGYICEGPSDASPYGVTMIPRSDVSGQTPGGWGENTALTVNFFLVAKWDNTSVAMGGANSAIAYAVKC